MKFNNKKILIIGGMGPQASVVLHSKIIERSTALGARHGSNFPHVTHLSIPIPEFIDNTVNKQSALKLLQDALAVVAQKQFTHTVIACNTAHLLIPELDLKLPGELVSLIECVAERLSTNEVKRIGLLASPTTIKEGLFHTQAPTNTTLVTSDLNEQQQTSTIIHKVIAGKLPVNELQRQIKKLQEHGCDEIILGCTELSVLQSIMNLSNIVDPLQLAVEKIFNDGE